MELYIFDEELNFKGILEQYTSLRWIRRYSNAGEFEIHCGLEDHMLELLKINNIIWKNDDLEAGHIVSRQLMEDEEGKETLVLRGSFLTGLLGQRIIWGQENISSTVEQAIRDLTANNVISPTDPDRKIDLFELGQAKNLKGDITYQVSYKNLLEEIELLSNKFGVGIRSIVDLERKKIIFDTYKGLDRSQGNGTNPPAIFSQEFDNVLKQEYSESSGDYRSIALIAGEGESEDRKLEIAGHGVGLDRYELYIDARDLQSTRQIDGQEDIIPEAEYKKMLIERGEVKLSEAREIKAFDSKIDPNSNLTYKEDFDLGDIVTYTSKKWGVTVDVRIMEIEEIYEGSSRDINIVFGDNWPTLIDKIKREVN